MSDSLQPHELQHTRLPCPPLSPEFAQTHVHWVGDSIQPPHPLSLPSQPSIFPSIRNFFQWVSSSHQVAKVLKMQLQLSPWEPWNHHHHPYLRYILGQLCDINGATARVKCVVCAVYGLAKRTEESLLTSEATHLWFSASGPCTPYV